MSLLKHLLLSVTIAIAGILLGTLVLSTDAARQYLNAQLQAQSENAAASLALSLSQPSNQDPVTQSLLLSALFDTGQFHRIRFVTTEGNTIFDQQRQSVGDARVPTWFTKFLPLERGHSQRAISDGWRQTGTVYVQADSKLATHTLWRSTLKTLLLVIGAGVVWSLFVVGLVRWFRRVLSNEIEAQVRAIGASHSAAPAVSEEGNLQELASVRHAIQDTHARVSRAAQAQSKRIESLELENHTDAVTGLPNRKYFQMLLAQALSLPQEGEDDAASGGQLLLMRQRDLQSINARQSRAVVDEWLHSMGQGVQTLVLESGRPGAHVARLNGADFAVLLPGEMGPQSMQLFERIRQQLMAQSMDLGNGVWSRWAFALTAFAQGDTPGLVLARLDQALMQAESAGHGAIEYVQSHVTDLAMAGEGHWQKLLQQALQDEHGLSLNITPRKAIGARSSHAWQEASLQLHQPSGEILASHLFWPSVVRLGLAAAFDTQAVRMGLQLLQSTDALEGRMLIVRVSLAALVDEDFFVALHALMEEAPPTSETARLSLEIDAHAVVTQPAAVRELALLAQQAGWGLGVRSVDLVPMALLHVQGLSVHYLKMGASFTVMAQDNVGARHLLQGILQAAQEQNCAVYVTEPVPPSMVQWLTAEGAYLPVPHV